MHIKYSRLIGKRVFHRSNGLIYMMIEKGTYTELVEAWPMLPASPQPSKKVGRRTCLKLSDFNID